MEVHQVSVSSLQTHPGNTFQSLTHILLLPLVRLCFIWSMDNRVILAGQFKFQWDLGNPVPFKIPFDVSCCIQKVILRLRKTWKEGIFKKQEWVFLCKTHLQHNLLSQWPPNSIFFILLLKFKVLHSIRLEGAFNTCIFCHPYKSKSRQQVQK